MKKNKSKYIRTIKDSLDGKITVADDVKDSLLYKATKKDISRQFSEMPM